MVVDANTSATSSATAPPVSEATKRSSVASDTPEHGDADAQQDRKPSKGNSAFKSNWRNDPNQKRDLVVWLLDLLDIFPLPDVQPKVDPNSRVAYLDSYTFFRWCAVRAFVPVAIQWSFAYLMNNVLYKGKESPFPASGWGPVFNIFFYVICYYTIGVQVIRTCRDLGAKYGFFDADVPRDEIPDSLRGRVAASVLMTVAQRTFMETVTTYDTSATPSVRWQLPLQMALYTWTLDFYYYWYHRVMHESESLWAYHRTHHLARHPNTLLTLFADDEQELFDMVGIPFITWLTMAAVPFLRPNFYEWWCCNTMVTIVELFGHCGVRMYFTSPQSFPFLLAYFDAEISLEDHDLHHRAGYRDLGGNYGKQTRIWDRLFGTVNPRIEGPNSNLDYDHPIKLGI